MGVHFSLSAGSLLIVLTLGVAACGGVAEESREAPLEAGQGSVVASRSANPDDPYGACERVPEPSQPFHYVCTAGSVDCTGWGGGQTVCNAGTSECINDQTFHLVCDHGCDTANDCPVPTTGTARAICQPDVHACQLTCDESTTCPDGYVCQSTSDWGLSTSGGVRIPAPFMCMQTFVIHGP